MIRVFLSKFFGFVVDRSKFRDKYSLNLTFLSNIIALVNLPMHFDLDELCFSFLLENLCIVYSSRRYVMKCFVI